MMASASPAKGKSWLSKLVGGGSDEAEDSLDGVPDVKAADAAAIAADTDAPMAKSAPKPAEVTPEPETVVAEADIPLPRPSPILRGAYDTADAVSAETVVAEAELPPIPRSSPIARPMVAMASASGETAKRDLVAFAGPAAPKTAADAIADAVGSRNADGGPLMAYAPVDTSTPHIDASSGALVAGRAAGLRGSVTRTNGVAEARLVPVGYSMATLQLVMRSGSIRQTDGAELVMPQPFALPEFFAAADEPTRSYFGRVAYNTKFRPDRSASAATSNGNMKVASN
jgi:hypothetical protein